MLSRVADSIYWLNRYIERAENVARVIDVNLHLALDTPGAGRERWEPVVSTTGDRDIFVEHFGDYTRENVIRFLVFDPDNTNSILSCLYKARENARSIREVVSSEMWEAVNTFYLLVRAQAFGDHETMIATPHAFLERCKVSSHTFAGVMEATMSHGEAWNFGRLGRFVERADKTSRILDVKYFVLLPDPSYVGSPLDNIQWAALLRSASALEMYRKRHGRIDPTRVAEFLVLDREFPRAMRHCLVCAEESLRAISGSPQATFQNPAEQRLGRLRATLDYARIDEIVAEGLHEFCDDFQAQLNGLGEAISETFFAAEPLPGGTVSSEMAG